MMNLLRLFGISLVVSFISAFIVRSRKLTIFFRFLSSLCLVIFSVIMLLSWKKTEISSKIDLFEFIVFFAIVQINIMGDTLNKVIANFNNNVKVNYTYKKNWATITKKRNATVFEKIQSIVIYFAVIPLLVAYGATLAYAFLSSLFDSIFFYIAFLIGAIVWMLCSIAKKN